MNYEKQISRAAIAYDDFRCELQDVWAIGTKADTEIATLRADLERVTVENERLRAGLGEIILTRASAAACIPEVDYVLDDISELIETSGAALADKEQSE